MLRVITNNDSKLDKRMNGTYILTYFGATGLSIGAGQNIIFFKMDGEVNTELVGNNHFTADGYLYDIHNNTTSNFTYIPKNTNEEQKLQFKNVKNIKMSFFDKDGTSVNITTWSMILKKV